MQHKGAVTPGRLIDLQPSTWEGGFSCKSSSTRRVMGRAHWLGVCAGSKSGTIQSCVMAIAEIMEHVMQRRRWLEFLSYSQHKEAEACLPWREP